MNREKAIREGFYQTLKNMSVTLPELGLFLVPVYSNKNESNEEMYVLITSQFGQNRSNLTSYQWKEVVTLEIYHTQQNSATYDFVDIISDEIERLILPEIPLYGNPDGLTPQPGWQFSCVELRDINSMALTLGQNRAQTTVLKQLQFSLIISKIS
jgi:hypothetical protein